MKASSSVLFVVVRVMRVVYQLGDQQANSQLNSSRRRFVLRAGSGYHR
jgi:hypothetical protein